MCNIIQKIKIEKHALEIKPIFYQGGKKKKWRSSILASPVMLHFYHGLGVQEHHMRGYSVKGMLRGRNNREKRAKLSNEKIRAQTARRRSMLAFAVTSTHIQKYAVPPMRSQRCATNKATYTSMLADFVDSFIQRNSTASFEADIN